MRRWSRSLGFLGLFTLVQNLFIFSPFRCQSACDLVYALLYLFFSRWSISLSMATALVRVDGDRLIFSSWQVRDRSRFSALIRCEILGICSLAAFAASLLMSSLKTCQRLWAFDDLSSVSSAARSEQSFRPLVLIVLFRFLSCSRPSGHVHLSFPMNGVFSGVSLTETILWSVGMAGILHDQSLIRPSSSSFAYILSNLDIVWVGEVNVKVRSVGKWSRHESLTPRSCLQSRKALVADSLSGRAGARSSGSSVVLKSPSTKSGSGRFMVVHLSASSVQNCVCLCGSFGAYTLIIRRVEFGCHLNDMKIALPGISMCVCMFSTLTISLLITKATPTDPERFSVPGEFIIVSRLWYKAAVWSASCSVRCVSCRARSPIFSCLIVLNTAAHFEVGPGPVSGDALPFMFRVASLKFALYFFGVFELLLGGGPCCVGVFIWGVSIEGGGSRGSIWGPGESPSPDMCVPAAGCGGCVSEGVGGAGRAAGLCEVDILLWLVCRVTLPCTLRHLRWARDS